MEEIMKKVVKGSLPYMVDYFMDNKHILVDFLRQQALKTNNELDDAIVDIFAKWLDTI